MRELRGRIPDYTTVWKRAKDTSSIDKTKLV